MFPLKVNTDVEVAPTKFATDLTIAYHNLNVTVKVPSNAGEIVTVLSPFKSALDSVLSCGASSKEQDFHRLLAASGRIRPGSMVLILAPPGHGKTTLLKALAQKQPIDSDSGDSGVRYNGLSRAEAEAQGCNVRRMCHYVDQVRSHIALSMLQVQPVRSSTFVLTSNLICANQ